MARNTFFAVVLLFLLCIARSGTAQVNVSLSVVPPYSTHLSDYGNNPGKIILLLSNTSTSGAPLQVMLQLSVTGLSNGISIRTKPAYKPSHAITLMPGIPLLVDAQMLMELFDASSLDLQKITQNDLMKMQGLPEGMYQICVRVFDYNNPSLPLSNAAPAGCTSIYLRLLEPPYLLKPAKDEVLKVFQPQNQVFSWTIPAGAPPGTQYLFRMVEVPNAQTNANAAYNAKTLPPFFETVTGANVFVYGPAEPQLVPGKVYAWAVTALDKYSTGGVSGSEGTAFTNGGRSEVHAFTVQAPKLVNTHSLAVIVPNAAKVKDTIEVSDDGSRLFGLAWKYGNGAASADADYMKDGITKYKITVTGASGESLYDKTFTYSKEINSAKPDSLPHHLQLTGAQCNTIGFKDHYWYKAIIHAYDKNGSELTEAGSVNFQYLVSTGNATGKRVFTQGTIKYQFKEHSDWYAVPHTPIEVYALVPKPTANKLGKKAAEKEFDIAAVGYAATDADGNYIASINLPAYLKNSDTIYFQARIKNKYYQNKALSPANASISEASKNLSLNNKDTLQMGTAHVYVYGYSLKLYVKKLFTSYAVSSLYHESMDLNVMKDSSFYKSEGCHIDGKSGKIVCDANVQQYEAGITIILYRKDKQITVPPIEGALTPDKIVNSGYVEVARGKTQLETDARGTTLSFVQFDKLVCRAYGGDEYYILALDAKAPAQKQEGRYNKPYSGRSSSTNVNFEAAEMHYSYSRSNRSDSLYAQVTTSYDITSKKPPTSLISGQLMYQWPGDVTKQVRPLAKAHYTVVVGYTWNGQPVGSLQGNLSFSSIGGSAANPTISSASSNSYFENADGSKSLLFDNGTAMGEGVTDANGNFSLTVTNYNPKGLVGKGKLIDESSSSSTTINIDPKTKSPSLLPKQGNPVNELTGGGILEGLGNDLYNTSLQNTMNEAGGFVTEKKGTGSFSIKAGAHVGTTGMLPVKQGLQQAIAAHGPSAGFTIMDDNLNDDNGPLQRVYFIRIDDNNYQDAAMPIVVNAFEAVSTGPVIVNVNEKVGYKIHVVNNADTTKRLANMQVLVFRDLASKPGNLPLGEGNNKYKKGPLINPELKQKEATVNTPKEAEAGIMDKTFEHIYQGITDANGDIKIPRLLIMGKYFMEGCSDPTTGNNFYKATIVDYAVTNTIALDALPSRVSGRVMDVSAQKAIPKAKVKWTINGTKMLFPIPCDDDGYFERLIDPTVKFAGDSNNLTVQLTPESIGYISADTPVFKQTLLRTGQQAAAMLKMKTNLTFDVTVVDENNKGVPAYLKREDGAVFITDSNGKYNVPIAVADPKQKLYIIPKDVGYFNDTVNVNSTFLKNVSKNTTLTIFRRKHRIRFTVKDAEGNNVEGAAVTLLSEDMSHTTSKKGEALFIYENVSVNNYTFSITGGNTLTTVGNKNQQLFVPGGFIPQTVSLSNSETKDTTAVTIILPKGSTLTGKVLLDNKPVGGARVYLNATVQLSAQVAPKQNDLAHVETFTGKDGSYSLSGIPVAHGSVEISATLDTSFTVIGATKTVVLTKSTGKQDFTLTASDIDIPSIYGFPVTIEEIKMSKTGNNEPVRAKPLSDGATVWVTGLVDLSSGNSDFTLLSDNQSVRVRDVPFTVKTINGRKVGVPASEKENLEGIIALKFRYVDQYNVQLNAIRATNNSDPLKPVIPAITELSISKLNNTQGGIAGKVHIIDNSFNYPGSYLNFTGKDNFYLAQVSNNSATTYINAVTATYDSHNTNIVRAQPKRVANAVPYKKYNLSDEKGNAIEFKFIEFPATADPLKSYIDAKGKIHLNISMKCTIANAEPANFSVTIGDVTLDGNAINPASGNTPIIVQMDKWQLLVKKWSVDPQHGGIYSENGLIHTTSLDIPFNYFNLRNDMFVFKGFNIGNISLGGGIAQLTAIDTNNVVLGYDKNVGSDHSGHWVFRVSGSNDQPAAIIPKFKDLISNDLPIDYIQLLSNDENTLSLRQTSTPQLLANNQLATFYPEGITNGTDNFRLYGRLQLTAPRLTPMQLNLDFRKKNGELQMTPSGVISSFEGKGYVQFHTKSNDVNNITITKDKLTIHGLLEEKPDATFAPMQADFVADAVKNSYSVQIMEANTKLTSNLSLNLVPGGGMKVIGKDWDILSFSGRLEETGKTNSALSGKDTLTFNVYGDVQVKGNSLTMSHDAGFGAFNMTFDYKKPELFGTLSIPKTQVGDFSFGGVMEMRFNKDGWYIAGSGTASSPVVPLVSDGWEAGFVFGDYNLEGDLWKTANQFIEPELIDNCFLQSNKHLKGFYFAGAKKILDIDVKKDFIIVSGYIYAKAAIGVGTYMNFEKSAAIGLRVAAFAAIGAGFSAPLVSGGIDARIIAGLGAEYKEKHFSISGDITAALAFHLSVGACPLCDEIDVDKNAVLRVNTAANPKLSFDFGSGTNIECPTDN
jgi:TANFOR domain-containing protein